VSFRRYCTNLLVADAVPDEERQQEEFGGKVVANCGPTGDGLFGIVKEGQHVPAGKGCTGVVIREVSRLLRLEKCFGQYPQSSRDRSRPQSPAHQGGKVS